MKKIKLSFLLSLCLTALSSCSVANRSKSNTPADIDPAEYVQTVETFQITFLNGDGSQLYNKKMNKGESLAKIANSLLPTLASDGDHDYTFKAWNPVPDVVTQDTVFRPQFEATEHEIFTYEIDSFNSGYYITSYNLQSRTTVTVPDTYGSFNTPVIGIKEGAFQNKSNLQTVILGENIQSIAANAFEGCSNLSTVVYTSDSTLTTIGEKAFSGCRKLKSFVPNAESSTESNIIQLPTSITRIDSLAFEGCYELNNLRIGANLINVGSNILKGCTSLTSIEINPDNEKFSSEESNIILNLTTGHIVAGCRTSLFTSTKITGIDDYVFDKITLVYPNPVDPSTYNTVSELVLHDKIVSIGEYAFSNNTSLTSVTMEGKITKLYQSSFEGCSNITSINITGESTDFMTSSNCIIRKAVSDNTVLPERLSVPFLLYGTAGMTQLDSTITGIGPKAFYKSNIETIVLGKTVQNNKITYLGAEAFRECTRLRTLKLYFPSMSNDSFLPTNLCRGCTSLTEILIPSCFYSMELADSDTKGNGSFYNCTSLHTVQIHSNLRTIHENTFTNCNSITKVYFSNNATIWNNLISQKFYKTAGNEGLFNCPNIEFGVFDV